MSDNPHPNLLDSQPEGVHYSNDDFEKLDAPGAFDTDSLNEASFQDKEVTSTSNVAGEDEAEEDRYAAGASEAEAIASQPLISWDDGLGDAVEASQPASAPVPDDSFDPLADFSRPDPEPHFTSSDPQDLFSNVIPSKSEPDVPEPQPSKISDSFKTFEEKESKQSMAPAKVVSEEAPKTEGSWLKGVDPRVVDLIYWRDVRTTGAVFGTMMFVLLSLAFFSVLSVVAYLSLAVLTVTFTFCVYKKVMAAVQKSNDGHPFKDYLGMEIALNEDQVKTVVQSVLRNINATSQELRRLFLIEDIVDSIKFGLLLWVLTYIGSWFNGMTLIILAVVFIFTLPKVYETYKVQIDNYIGLAKSHIDNVVSIVQSKLPFLKKKAKAQ